MKKTKDDTKPVTLQETLPQEMEYIRKEWHVFYRRETGKYDNMQGFAIYPYMNKPLSADLLEHAECSMLVHLFKTRENGCLPSGFKAIGRDLEADAIMAVADVVRGDA